MDFILILKAIIMGVVEGLTEFLPISSTGHLILAGSLLNFTGDKVKVFEIVIQAGAIFAVMWEYRSRLAQIVCGVWYDSLIQKFVLNVMIAFLPAAILGVIFGKQIKAVLFAPVPVALAFIVGGVIIFLVDGREHSRASHITDISQISAWDAFKIGCMQAFALIPGTSRSGATIIGGMVLGLSRKVAVEFSFFLAMPTLLGATVYSLYKDRALLSAADLPLFSVGTIAAFISAFICVRWLLRYVSSHDFTVFAWYRIVFGLVILATAFSGVVVWVD